MADQLHPVDGLDVGHALGGEHLVADDDRRVVVLDRFLDRDFAGRHRADSVGARRGDVDDAETAGRRLAEEAGRCWPRWTFLRSLAWRIRSTSLPMARSNATYLSEPAASARTSGPGPTTVSSTRSSPLEPARLVVAGHLHVERDRTFREVVDLRRLLGGVLTETIRDPQVPSGDGDVHSCLHLGRRPPAEAGGHFRSPLRPTLVLGAGDVTGCLTRRGVNREGGTGHDLAAGGSNGAGGLAHRRAGGEHVVHDDEAAAVEASGSRRRCWSRFAAALLRRQRLLAGAGTRVREDPRRGAAGFAEQQAHRVVPAGAPGAATGRDRGEFDRFVVRGRGPPPPPCAAAKNRAVSVRPCSLNARRMRRVTAS